MKKKFLIIKEKLQIKKISMRLTLIFLCMTFVVFCIFFAITSSMFSDKLTDEMNIVASQQLDFASSLLDSTIEEIRNLGFSLVKLPRMQAALKDIEAGADIDSAAFKEQKKALKQEIDEMSRNSSLNVRSMFAVSKEGEILDPLYSGESYEWLIKDNLEFNRFLSSQLTQKLTSLNSFPFQPGVGKLYENATLTCFGRIYDINEYYDLGYVAINFNQKSLFTEIEQIFKDTFAKAYVVDENQNIIFSNAEMPEEPLGFLEKEYPKYGKMVEINHISYMAYSCQVDSYPNWKIIGFIDYHQVYQPLRNIYMYLFLVLILFMVFMGVANYYTSRHITMPIRIMNDAMKEIGEGKWPSPLKATTKDEMSELVEGFNQMNVDLQNMTAEIALQLERARKDEVALVQSQLDLLESQINPHFIHNTLNTMRYMAKVAHADKLADLINSFNALLRTSMAQDNMMIPMIEEVDNLYHYMDIQRERYDMDIDFRCEISEEAEYVLIPKLILQPLVENSLFHGIAPNGGGSIRVRAEVADKRLWVVIWDDGAGIPKDKLFMIKQGAVECNRGYNKIGIANVNERLQLSYGASSHLVIDSDGIKGTDCCFSISLVPK